MRATLTILRLLRSIICVGTSATMASGPCILVALGFSGEEPQP